MSVPFAVVEAIGVDDGRLRRRIDAVVPDVLDDLRADGSVAMATAAAFGEFFESHGHRSPLVPQLESAARKGFRDLPAPVLSLLVAEAATGVLMGVQDGGAIDGPVRIEALPAAESFEGMRSTIHCEPSEIVVRDDAGIIASLFRGPDRRTAVGPASTHLVYLVFGFPGFDRLDAAVDVVRSLVDSAADSCRVVTSTSSRPTDP